MRNRLFSVTGLLLVVLLTAGCPKGKEEFQKGRQAELNKDYDTALIHYERALKADPDNSRYQLRARRMRFEAAQMHVERGQSLRDQGLLEPAAAEFEKAVAIDPSSFVAEQELQRTLEMITARREAEEEAARRMQKQEQAKFDEIPPGPPELKPISRQPINLQATEDARKIYTAIGDLAGINVIFDPEFQPRRVSVELQQATLEQALDIVALMTNTFWKPVTSNTIMIIPDTPAKRKAYEEQVIKTFYLTNTIEAAELNEIVQTLRTLLDIRRITPSTANNAIIIRDTPDKVAVAEKIIRDIDQAKPEVLIQVAVLQARRDRARDLGILPSSTVPLLFTPRSVIQPEDAGDVSAARLDELDRIGSRDYSVVLPSATANLLLTDASTQVIQNPQVRVTDGQTAKLRIGDRVPFATGSFQPGIGGVGVNPLVNTQFQFQDVGVNLDVTPRVHSNREVTLQVKVEVSSVTGQVNIGGIEQPIFGQRSVEHNIRLREGEVNILGGIIERTESVNISGWPGLSRVPFLRYLFSTENKEELENEVLLVLTPRIIRLPEITAASVRPLAVGTDQQVTLPRGLEDEVLQPAPGQRPAQPPGVDEQELGPQPPAPPQPPEPEPSQPETSASPEPEAQEPSPAPQTSVRGPAQLSLEPARVTINTGQRGMVNIAIQDAKDLFSIPLVLSFDPSIVQLVEVHHGGFLGGEKPAALVHRVDQEAGVAVISVSRPPGARGVSGTGKLVTLVFEGKAPGSSGLLIEQVVARDARQQPLDLQVAPGEIVVQ